jgi:hypothetical protein
VSEQFEQFGHIFGFDTIASVDQAHLDKAFLFSAHDGDLTSWLGELKGVALEVQDHLLESHFVGDNTEIVAGETHEL